VKRANLRDLTVDQLAQRFAATEIEEDKAEQVGDRAKLRYLRLHMFAIAKELKGRPGDQRRALLALYDHPNMQVRLMAAKCSLAISPHEARRVIETIAASRCFPQAGDAGMCLVMLDRGIFVPD
jgi:hypothetical protein